MFCIRAAALTVLLGIGALHIFPEDPLEFGGSAAPHTSCACNPPRGNLAGWQPHTKARLTCCMHSRLSQLFVHLHLQLSAMPMRQLLVSQLALDSNM